MTMELRTKTTCSSFIVAIHHAVRFAVLLFVVRSNAIDGFHLSHSRQQKTHISTTTNFWHPTKNSSFQDSNHDRSKAVSSILSLSSSNDGSSSQDGSSDDSSLVEAMRRLLESSWDANTMGRVPLDATSGANEVYAALLEAEQRRNDESTPKIYCVELLLPAYDVTQGDRMYDEVMATEFCIALAQCLKGKSEILVRDQKTLDTVQKVLSARERWNDDNNSEEDDEDDFDDEDEDDQVDDSDSPDNDNENNEGEEIILEGDVDSFRKKLMSGWDVTTNADNVPMEESSVDLPTEPPRSPASSDTKRSKQNKQNKRHRLASLFGSERISTSGPDMPQDVVRAVRNNAMAMQDEETIIILGAHGQDEMVAVRALVEKYQKEKSIILVNCLFTQTPRELQKAEIVYSILPLVVKEKETGRNLSIRDNNEDGSSKVVVLRRYPKDWEMFVDIGNGFELAETMRVRPTMQAVTECLQRYLKSI
ncbi:DUF1995 domain containing protein [Nitzschia inconspicua]|uniref:DUF1995 domain containing protein n=1 Tax=Nitzschia inconspicua TaxID=303405 RepID=A0A9K3PEK0_9STRA|nr:DUF1995 domain containing protein [Nitzschia inconspicua]